MTLALRSLVSVFVLACASSPVRADLTVTVLGMANGGSRPVLINKDIRAAVELRADGIRVGIFPSKIGSHIPS